MNYRKSGLIIGAVIAAGCLTLFATWYDPSVWACPSISSPDGDYTVHIRSHAQFDDVSFRLSMVIEAGEQRFETPTIAYVDVASDSPNLCDRLLTVFPEGWDGFYVVYRDKPTDILAFYHAEDMYIFPATTADISARHGGHEAYSEAFEVISTELLDSLNENSAHPYSISPR